MLETFIIGQFHPAHPTEQKVITMEVTVTPNVYQIGTEGWKGIGQARRKPEEREEIYFAREPNDSTHPETQWPAVQAKYQWLQLHGFPVPPELYYDMVHQLYLITPMQPENAVIIDTHNPLLSSGITIDNYDQVIQQLRDMAMGAYNDGSGVMLGTDAYAVRIVDGKGEIILCDIFRGTKKATNGHDESGQSILPVQPYLAVNAFIGRAL